MNTKSKDKFQFSKNFHLSELLRSQTARRKGGDVEKDQFNPGADTIDNLKYLTVSALQPLRTLLQTSIAVNSGYRCELLNTAIGGSSKSQHVDGMAADLVLSGELVNRPSRKRIKTILNNKIRKATGAAVRDDVNSNYYLFAAAILYADKLDVDQLIHEYGDEGSPDWVHISCGRESKHRREILIASRVNNKTAYTRMTRKDALMLGCA